MKPSFSALALLFLAACHVSADPGSTTPHLRISGPFLHEHLALFIVEDPAAASAGEFITLAEGMASGAVKVTEKKQAEVGELLIENTSSLPCFVQAGDVVQGGQQDRAISRDFVIPAGTPPTPVSSFCVEQARWQGSGRFTASTQNATSNIVRLGIQYWNSQSEVWKSVGRYKADFRSNNRLPEARSTSINEELDETVTKARLQRFRDALSGLLKDRPQAVGLVVALNGKLNNADLYADPGLFRKLYPRLLDAAALDAISLKAEPSPRTPAVAEASAFLNRAAKGTSKEEMIRDGLEVCTVENDRSVQFDYVWQGRSLHRQALAR